VLYRCRFPGRRALRALVSVPFVLPTVVVGVAFQSLLAPKGPLGFLGLQESFAAIVAALVFFNDSVVVRTVGALWSRLDPRAEDAARTLGAGRTRVLATVTLPALAPAIASASALVFLFCASAFGVVLVLGGSSYGTIETEIWYQTTQLLDLPAAAALSILQLVVVTASLLVAGATRSRQERALRLSGNPVDRALRAQDLPAVAVTAVVVLGLLLFPMASLAWRSLVTTDGIGLANYAALSGTTGQLTVSVWQALANSLAAALAATGIAVGLGLLVSYVLSRRPASVPGRRWLRTLDAVFMLPLGVSAVTVGFGFLITLNRPPLDLRSSWLLIPIAQAMVALPLVVRTLLPTLRAIDPRLHEVAATLGAAPGRVVATIDLPFALRGLGLAVGFAFATSLGEFGATSFLARPDRPTLPVVIFQLIGRPGPQNFGMALAASVVLAVLTAVAMGLAEWIGPKEVNPW
jgi:thiamine transport system permease protein